jgi:hypothetical protein
LTLYHTNGIGWTKVDFRDSAKTTKDKARQNYFGDVFRFGNFWEGGIKFQFYKSIGLSASFERSLVYPRHLFWYWSASMIIESAGQGAIDAFVKAIMKSSPYAGPVTSFILKNGLSFGLYELRRKNMNWPIQTDAPLVYDNAKIGLSFTF